jgi:hypothetical protein
MIVNRCIGVTLGILALWSIGISLTPAAELHTGDPIRIDACNPRPGFVSYPGFAPGYYPINRYYWYDVYGYYYYQPPFVSNPTLAIDYVNVSSRTAEVIEFGLIAHRELVAEVRDVGTFSPDVTIKHEFGLSPNVFPLETAMVRCVPLYVRFEDGTRWRNPHLPSLRRSMYPPE